MKSSDDKTTGKMPDIVKRSFEKETDGKQHEANRRAAGEVERRSVLGAPVDPNSSTTKGAFPPGVPPEDVVDPGRATPDAADPVSRGGDRAEDDKSRK